MARSGDEVNIDPLSRRLLIQTKGEANASSFFLSSLCVLSVSAVYHLLEPKSAAASEAEGGSFSKSIL